MRPLVFCKAGIKTIRKKMAGAPTSSALVGAPAIFFLIVFMPALQNTKGRMVGYKDHKTYGDISSYENAPVDQTKFNFELSQ